MSNATIIATSEQEWPHIRINGVTLEQEAIARRCSTTRRQSTGGSVSGVPVAGDPHFVAAACG
jgi:hypothetical protein